MVLDLLSVAPVGAGDETEPAVRSKHLGLGGISLQFGSPGVSGDDLVVGFRI